MEGASLSMKLFATQQLNLPQGEYAGENLSAQEVLYVNRRLAEEFIERLGYDTTTSNIDYMATLISQFEASQEV